MGSKQAIVASIVSALPRAENFYDLFGGGFSVSHYVLQERKDKYKHVHYNEIKADVVDLVKRSIAGEYNEKVFKQPWVSKKEFFQRLNEAYIRQIWSFGNSGDSYLYSEQIEPYKKSMHMAVVFGEFDSLAQEVLGFNRWPKEADSIVKRRLYLRQKLSWFNEHKRIPKVLWKFMSEEQLQQTGKKDNVKQLEQLQRLERLQQLQQLQTSSSSYEHIEIKRNSVVYCDIPYEGTCDYSNSFDRKKFLDWAANSSFPVFISEYNVSDSRFKLFYTIDKRVLLSAENTLNIKQEKLYWNGVEVSSHA